MLGIVDYSMGNLASVRNALDHLGIHNRYVKSYDDVQKVDKLILPGVGAFGMAMEKLAERDLIEGICEHAHIKKKPILGICLGMQLLLESSEEYGLHQGLKLIDGKVKSLKSISNKVNVPNIGWHRISKCGDSYLLKDLSENDSFYFAHSYYCDISGDYSAARLNYGVEFDVCLEKDNIFASQFHPEKSQRPGLNILKNFAKL